jgi:hypothetical protein
VIVNIFDCGANNTYRQPEENNFNFEVNHRLTQ